MLTERSTERPIDVDSVSLSLAASVSDSFTVSTEAVELTTSVPSAADESAVRRRVNVAFAPEARSPTVQVPFKPPLYVPSLSVNEASVTPDGRVRTSLIPTPDAADGPLLDTVTT